MSFLCSWLGSARLIPGIANNPTMLRGSSAEAADVRNTEGELQSQITGACSLPPTPHSKKNRGINNVALAVTGSCQAARAIYFGMAEKFFGSAAG